MNIKRSHHQLLGGLVLGSNTNEFIRKSGSNGLTLKPTGDTPSGNLDVGPSQAQTSIKAYVNHWDTKAM